MSQNIINEVTFFLHSFMMGIVITFMYDGFLILRRLIKHSDILVSLEDMVFWIACAIGVFYMLYEENNGILRWFAVFGAALGMIVYKKKPQRSGYSLCVHADRTNIPYFVSHPSSFSLSVQISAAENHGISQVFPTEGKESRKMRKK